MTTFAPPLRALITRLLTRWRNRHGCRHEGWTPLEGCPDCGEL